MLRCEKKQNKRKDNLKKWRINNFFKSGTKLKKATETDEYSTRKYREKSCGSGIEMKEWKIHECGSGVCRDYRRVERSKRHKSSVRHESNDSNRHDITSCNVLEEAHDNTTCTKRGRRRDSWSRYTDFLRHCWSTRLINRFC